MGGSSSQVTGYRYFTNLLLFIGNPIEKMLGINFDKRGWLSPFVDENGNALAQGVINSPSLFGENEGGVAGVVNVQYGTENQEVLPFYKDYMESKELQASAYPYQSYLAFKDFYVGNSGYMKEMLLWPKRIHVRNDGRPQWYDEKAEIPEIKTVYAGLVDSDLGLEGFDIKWELITDATPFIYTDNNKIVHYDGNTEVVSSESDGVLVKGNPSSYNKPFDIYLKASPECDGLSEFKAYLTIIGGSYNYEIYGEVYSHATISETAIDQEKLVTIDGVVDTSAKVIGVHLRVNDMIMSSGVPTICAKAVFSFSKPKNRIEYRNYSSPDINPIHKIREILTDDTAMNKPETSVNNDNFIKVADRIWDEGLGISWSITEKSCIDAINELCYHIEAGIRVNRQTGLYEIVLFRDDWFEESEIHTIAESKIKSMLYEITNADEAINQVNVNYYDRANIKNSSFSISESGLIQTLGRVNAETVDFPYFMNMRNAEIVANWKLKILSTGAIKGTFTTGWRDARKWNRYDLIQLPWSKRWTGTILVRIVSINLGGPTNNEVSVEWVEVVPSTGMMNTTIVADDPMDKPLQPQACQYEPFELPYYLVVMALGQRKADEELAYESNFGLVAAVAEKPQENSLYAVMMTNNGDEWVRAGSIQYSVTADLDQIISKTSSSFMVKNWKMIANVPAGTLIKCGRDWLGTPGEWMVFQGVDPYTGIITVKRGALDTPPQEWGVDTKLYFCGNDISYDQTEYVSGEEVLVSALTTTPSGVLEQGGSIPVEMNARAIRPYPPANVKINNEYWPEVIRQSIQTIEITWGHRNRIQQTGGSIIGWYEGSVSIESGVEYIVHVYDRSSLVIQSNLGSVNNFSFDSELITSGMCRVQIFSQRDGYTSLHLFEHDFMVENSKVIFIFNESNNYIPPTANSVNFTEQ